MGKQIEIFVDKNSTGYGILQDETITAVKKLKKGVKIPAKLLKQIPIVRTSLTLDNEPTYYFVRFDDEKKELYLTKKNS